MSFEDILKRNPNLTIKDLQELQENYDNRFVAPKGFLEFKKVSHTYAHMGKLLGKLANYVHDIEENRENVSAEQIKNEVIPDLLVYSAWLANEFKVDIEEAYLKRILRNIKKYYSNKVSSEEMKSLENYIKDKTNKKG
jgi:hypothetical protein